MIFELGIEKLRHLTPDSEFPMNQGPIYQIVMIVSFVLDP